MKFRITSEVRSAPQCSSNFLNKIEANGLILPTSTPNLIIPFLSAMDFTLVEKEEDVKDVTGLLLFICTKLVLMGF